MTGAGVGRPRVVVAAACTTLHICFGTVYAWSFFQTLLVRQSGWTFTETAVAFSLAIFSLGISAAWAGRVLSRFGPRKLALAGSALFSGGYLVAALALRLDLVPLFWLGFGVIGGIGIGVGYVTPVATVVKWFPHRKGLAAGIVIMGFGVGALLLTKGLAPVLVAGVSGDLSLVFFWLGLIFAAILIPASLLLANPPSAPSGETGGAAPQPPGPEAVARYLNTGQFRVIWLVFFFGAAAGMTIIAFQSELLQEIWLAADPSLGPLVLADYGATLIAVSSVFNALGRLFWGLLSDRIGRVKIFRIVLASQMVVFGILLTETNPWVFSALVCYVLFCFGGVIAAMPSFILHVFGGRRMSAIYGSVLTAWAAAGIVGPPYIGHVKDVYPDRAVMYCFLIGILLLGAGYLFSYLLNDDAVRLGRPTVAGTLREYGIPLPEAR